MAIDTPESWGLRLWSASALVTICAVVLLSYGMATWPMVDDEVPSLVELGLVDIPASTFSVPPDQVGRLARTNPVWYVLQRPLLRQLPAGEFWYRLPSLVISVTTVAVVFVGAARLAGLSMAFALAGMVLGSPLFLLIAQVNRFYALPLLLLIVALSLVWSTRRGALTLGLTALLVSLTVLSHNLTMVVFVLALLSSLAAAVVTRVPPRVTIRSGLGAVIGLLLYVVYVRPLVAGWHSTGNPTPVLVSFAAYAGIPTLSLAGLGMWFAATRRREVPVFVWFGTMLLGSICVMLLGDISWNPRYFLFFLPALWVMAAYGVSEVGRVIGGVWSRAVWYACVALMLAPGVGSHLIDGSRHDYRSAVAVLVRHVSGDQPILSDDAETLSFYLPRALWGQLQVRTKVPVPPVAEYFLVTRANVWMPLPEVPGRRMYLLAEIGQRRYDQFSHILRVYRVAAEAP